MFFHIGGLTLDYVGQAFHSSSFPNSIRALGAPSHGFSAPPYKLLAPPPIGFQHVYYRFSKTAHCGCLLCFSNLSNFFILNGKKMFAQNCLKTVFRPYFFFEFPHLLCSMYYVVVVPYVLKIISRH